MMLQKLPDISVVIPLHNEANTLVELISRTRAALDRVALPSEIVLVDDASTDTTRAIAEALTPPVRLVRLQTNRGQLGATKAGLVAARGRIVVVLDGDLQDPPEPLPDLVAALRADPRADAVFMVKDHAPDPAWMKIGRFGYRALQAVPGAARLPHGAGSYVAMRGKLARRIARTRVVDGNLSAIIAGLGLSSGSLPYARSARVDGASRVGFQRLVREAVSSLVLTGAATIWLVLIGLVSIAFAVRKRTFSALIVALCSLWWANETDAIRHKRLSGGA